MLMATPLRGATSVTFTPNTDSLLVEGYYVPPKLEEKHGPPTGSVEWLLNAVSRHAAAEADSLTQYEYLAEASGDPVVALVMRLILEDEERHHGLLLRIESSLRDALEWSHSPDALPSNAAPPLPVFDDFTALARDLGDEERAGARKMRELAESEKKIDGGLHSLLLDMMAMDSDKHARMLHFVEQRLRATRH
jgi:hypothetical protein